MIKLLIMLAPIMGHIMLTRKDSGGITNGNETRVDVCVNPTGLEKAKCRSDKASCYFRVVKASNNTGHIREMCLGVWGEEPNVMRYCRDYA